MKKRHISSVLVLTLLSAAYLDAAEYTFSGLTGTENFSDGPGWSSTPVSASDTILTYSGTLGAGATVFSNNDVGTFSLNRLNMNYSNSGTSVTLTGDPLDFKVNGATNPYFYRGSGPQLFVQNNLVLSGDLVVFSANSNALTLNGAITGTAGITFSSTDTQNMNYFLSNSDNDYQGDTRASLTSHVNRTLTLHMGGANVIPNGSGRGNLVLATPPSYTNTTGSTVAVNLNNFDQTVNGLVSDGATTIRHFVRNQAVGTATLTVGDNDTTATFGGNVTNGSTATRILALTKIGSGTQTLLGTNSYTGATIVNGGRLLINGTLTGTSGVTVNDTGTFDYHNASGLDRAVTANQGGTFRYNSAGAYTGTLNMAGGTVTGAGNLGATTLAGTGSVDPGNSPGILTAAAFDGSSGLGANFEFTAAGVPPTWSNSVASVNDVLRLTDATPFTVELDTSNTISIYLGLAAVTGGEVFQGGFYTDQDNDFLAEVSAADYDFYVLGDGFGTHAYNSESYYTLAEYNPGLTVDVGTLQVASADFTGGTVFDGYVTTFAVVPEPATLVLLLLSGLSILILHRRR